MHSVNLTTAQILEVFSDEIVARRGRVTDTFNDGRRLFSRSILPDVKEVRPRDRLQGGVAIKATEEEICLYPYIFRLVCSNGAIAAEALESRAIPIVAHSLPSTTLDSIREGIEACCTEKVFSQSVRKMRKAAHFEIDDALNILPMLARFSDGLGAQMTSMILDQFFKQKDQTQFGLANAVTAIARDTKDPQSRWDLEELGGRIAIAAPTRRPKGGARARAPRSLAVA